MKIKINLISFTYITPSKTGKSRGEKILYTQVLKPGKNKLNTDRNFNINFPSKCKRFTTRKKIHI